MPSYHASLGDCQQQSHFPETQDSFVSLSECLPLNLVIKLTVKRKSSSGTQAVEILRMFCSSSVPLQSISTHDAMFYCKT